MNQGFFEGFENIEKKRKYIKNKKQYNCESCGLYKNCITPKMQPTGKGKLKILIVAEANEKREDEKGIQLIGETGQYVRETLEDMGYDLDRDFWKTNSIICRPINNKTPTTLQIRACRKYLFETIEKYKPKAIILMGKSALESLLGERIIGRIKNVKYSDWVNEIIPDQELQIYVCPIHHPSYVFIYNQDNILKRMWKKSIKKIIDVVKNKPFYIHNYEKDILITQNKNEAISWIKEIRNKTDIISFDYETTGLKPHRKEHKIVSCSFSDGLLGYSFPFFEDKEFRKEWKKLIGSKEIKCIAHKSSFESMWTQIICDYSVKKWYWDTMIVQKILHNKKTTQLKFWSYIKFGVLGYDKSMDRYIEKYKEGEDKKSANAFNKIDEAPLDELLEYNALDSLFTYKLYEEQKKEIDNHLEKGLKLFIEGSKFLLQAQMNGVKLNIDLLKKYEKKIIKRLKNIEQKIMDSKEVKKWDGEKEFEFTSTKQLSHLLYDCLGVSVQNKTEKGNPSVDFDTLEKINLSIAQNIIRYRKWYKILNTYLKQYEREQVNSYLHPFYNLGNVKTFRSSSSNPNFQNVEKRNERARKIIRSTIIPRNGNKLIEWDFKSMEVSIAACYNKDPNLIKYLEDDTTDMHRDQASELFLCNTNEVTKYERYLAKSEFVFASFYGSYYMLTAPKLWEGMEQNTKNRLKKKGIKNYVQFENHVRKVELVFWEDKFPIYAAWKRKTIKEYEKKGYIELYTGFRCYGPMSNNEIINYRIQGSAFHCLLWTFNNVMNKMNIMKKFDKSFLIGQIHDSMLGDIHPDDEKEIDYLIWYYGTQKIREYWDWIIVPLRIEKERSEINGSWAEMSDCGYLKGE